MVECGNALLKNGYKVKILNTINFKKSMHYNPFSYVHSEKDILKLVTTLMTNTKGEGSGGDPFWEKSERLLLTALIAYLHYEAPVEEQNFATLAMSYAKVLGATNRQDGYLEGNGYLVSWCVGHLVELAPPNVYDAKYVKWSIADLPILPQKWQYLVSASTKKQFGILQKLMHRPDVDSVICATDAG